MPNWSDDEGWCRCGNEKQAGRHTLGGPGCFFEKPEPLPVSIPTKAGVVDMREAVGPCEVHDWPTEGMGKRLVAEMRARHGKGGINVCVDCLRRARDTAEREGSGRR
jgi:hypothetical protein